MNNEQAIASVCHRRLDPLSLVQLQEVLTYRWQSAHPQPSQPPRCALPGYPCHRLATSTSSPALSLPSLESPRGPRTYVRASSRHIELPAVAAPGSSGALGALGASPAARAAAALPDFTKSRGLERHERLRDGRK